MIVSLAAWFAASKSAFVAAKEDIVGYKTISSARQANSREGYQGCFTICPVAFLQNLKITLEMIKWEHSIFALPFALCGAMLAAGGLPAWRQLAWIVVAMISARSAAMAFNRLADASIDATNPRTASRALPVGLFDTGVCECVRSGRVRGSSCLPLRSLNRLTLVLSPVALAVILLYSYSKRFTSWSHLVSRIGAGHCSFGGLDRGARLARSADTAVYRCGDVLGRADST